MLLFTCTTINWINATTACTGISISTPSASYIHARTIEWGENSLNSQLVIAPRDYRYTSQLPNQQTGLSWSSRLGFVGISVSLDKYIAEGINEAGLTAGLFYFKGYGSLAPVDAKNTQNNITDMDVVRWVLSQFETVEQVKSALPTIKIIPVYVDEEGNPSPTAHWRITDKNRGKHCP